MLAIMPDRITVNHLLEKWRDIVGEIERTENRLRELVANRAHIEAAVRIFDPDATFGKPRKVTIRHAAFKGEMARFVLNALRASKEPMTSLELARQVMQGRGIAQTPEMTIVTRKRTTQCLLNLKEKGVVRSVPIAEGFNRGWEIAR